MGELFPHFDNNILILRENPSFSHDFVSECSAVLVHDVMFSLKHTKFVK